MVIQRFRPDFGGQGVQVEELCRALVGRGVRPVIISATRGRQSEWEDCDGYTVRRLRADLIPGSAGTTRLWMPIFGLRVFLALLRLRQVDVVHVHGLSDALYGALLFCRLRSVPLIFEMTLIGADDPSTALEARHTLAGLRRRAYRSCDAYVAMSAAFLPSFAAANLPHERLHVIPQGVDVTRFHPRSAAERAAARAELGLGASAPVVAFVGSLIERKGIDLLLAAWARIHASRPDARLLLVGKDRFEPGSADAQFLPRQFASLSGSAAATVHSLGLRDDPERWLGAADIFAFPSRREGFGSVIIEAMACGLPCVVAGLDGITDFVFASPTHAGGRADADSDGIVVPQDDVLALATAILGLMGDPDRAAAIGRTALARVRDAFDMDRAVAPVYARLYASLARLEGRA